MTWQGPCPGRVRGKGGSRYKASQNAQERSDGVARLARPEYPKEATSIVRRSGADGCRWVPIVAIGRSIVFSPLPQWVITCHTHMLRILSPRQDNPGFRRIGAVSG
jgi:hypothetical protein